MGFFVTIGRKVCAIYEYFQPAVINTCKLRILAIELISDERKIKKKTLPIFRQVTKCWLSFV